MSNKIAFYILVILLLLAWTVGRIECGKRKNQGNPKDKGKALKNPMDESQNTAAGSAEENDANDPEKGSDAEMEEKMPPPQEGLKDGKEKGRKRKRAGVTAPPHWFGVNKFLLLSKSERKRISQRNRKARKQRRLVAVSKEMEEIEAEQKVVGEGQQMVIQKIATVEEEYEQLKEENRQIIKQSARTQVKLALMFQIIKIREEYGEGSDEQEKELMEKLRTIVEKEKEEEKENMARRRGTSFSSLIKALRTIMEKKEEREKARQESLLTHQIAEVRRMEMAGGASSSAHHAAAAHLTPQNNIEGVKKEKEELSYADNQMQIDGHRPHANVKLEPKEGEDEKEEKREDGHSRSNGNKDTKRKGKEKKQ